MTFFTQAVAAIGLLISSVLGVMPFYNAHDESVDTTITAQETQTSQPTIVDNESVHNTGSKDTIVNSDTPYLQANDSEDTTLSLYNIKNGRVYYGHQNSNFSLIEIVGADIDTFVNLGGSYAKDKFHVYVNSQVRDDIDPATFDSIPGGFTRDRTHVWTQYGEDVSGVDPATVTVVDPESGNIFWIKDKNGVYFLNYLAELGDPFAGIIKLPMANPETFGSVDKGDFGLGYASDGINVYYKSKKLDGADPVSFAAHMPRNYIQSGFGPDNVEWEGMASDKKHVYSHGKTVVGADASTFEYVRTISGRSTRYAKDALHVYSQLSVDGEYVTEQLKNSDAPTFALLNNTKNTEEGYMEGGMQYSGTGVQYAKDKNNVYYIGKILEGADSETFVTPVPDGNNFTGKDKNHVYSGGKILD